MPVSLQCFIGVGLDSLHAFFFIFLVDGSRWRHFALISDTHCRASPQRETQENQEGGPSSETPITYQGKLP